MKHVLFRGSPVVFPLAVLLVFSACTGLPRSAPSPAPEGKALPALPPPLPAELPPLSLPAPPEKAGERAAAEQPEAAGKAAGPEGTLLPRREAAEASLPPETAPAAAVEAAPEAVAGERERPETLPETGRASLPPEQPRIPPVPERLLGQGLAAPEKLAAFLLRVNPEADPRFTEHLAAAYVDEAGIEGINHDAAFAQMCLETGFLKFGGLVTPEMNNFCGLGSIGPGQPGERFPDSRTGVRAHIQHLKAYATREPPKQELVDPRYHRVLPGSSPGIGGLAGTWAADKAYGDKIKNILVRLYEFSFY